MSEGRNSGAAAPKRGAVGRRLLLVSTPVVVTLASRSALATGTPHHMCTNSVMQSLALNPNVSHHAGTTPSNCGVPHECWKDHHWTSCKPNVWDGCKSYHANCKISTCLGMDGTHWKVKDGCADDLFEGLCGQVKFMAKKKKYQSSWNNDYEWKECADTDFVKECIASICNADGWGPDHFGNRSCDSVRSYLRSAVWNTIVPYGSSNTPSTVCSSAKSQLHVWNNPNNP